MSSFERLRPFVSFCQGSGFIPYVIEYDQKTQQFLKFSFSWKNLTTWWFILMLILQVTLPLVTGLLLSSEVIGKVNSDNNTPVTISILLNMTVMCYIVHIVISRWIILRHYLQLQNLVESALQVEMFLKRTNHRSYRSCFLRRFILGFILIVFSVIVLFSIILHV